MSDPDDKGLVWDENDEFIKQSWRDLKRKILSTRGGIGIIASDFDELLRPGYGIGIGRREHFTKLVRGATEDDIELLADILAIIMRKPWESNLQGGWFIRGLRKKDNIGKLDSHRAALVINRLYERHPFAAEVLIRTLRSFADPENRDLFAVIKKTKKLNLRLLLLLNPASIFISYAREDDKKAERLHDALQMKGYKVWKDNHALLPGERWEHKIKQALRGYEFVILCLSKISISKTGFFQEEVKTAAELQRKRPSSHVYIIPVRFDNFDLRDLPIEIEGLHHIDLFKNWNEGLNKIAETISQYRKEG
jgi:hypothetical protein